MLGTDLKISLSVQSITLFPGLQTKPGGVQWPGNESCDTLTFANSPCVWRPPSCLSHPPLSTHTHHVNRRSSCHGSHHPEYLAARREVRACGDFLLAEIRARESLVERFSTTHLCVQVASIYGNGKSRDRGRRDSVVTCTS